VLQGPCSVTGPVSHSTYIGLVQERQHMVASYTLMSCFSVVSTVVTAALSCLFLFERLLTAVDHACSQQASNQFSLQSMVLCDGLWTCIWAYDLNL
jgi:hypothetical protein